MAYSKAKEDARAVRTHDEALANYERARADMDAAARECGRDSAEYREARRVVSLLRGDVTKARERVDSCRSWRR